MDHKVGVSLLLLLLLGLCNAQPEDVRNYTLNTRLISSKCILKDLFKIENDPSKSANCLNICIVFHRTTMLVSG